MCNSDLVDKCQIVEAEIDHYLSQMKSSKDACSTGFFGMLADLIDYAYRYDGSQDMTEEILDIARNFADVSHDYCDMLTLRDAEDKYGRRPR